MQGPLLDEEAGPCAGPGLQPQSVGLKILPYVLTLLSSYLLQPINIYLWFARTINILVVCSDSFYFYLSIYLYMMHIYIMNNLKNTIY